MSYRLPFRIALLGITLVSLLSFSAAQVHAATFLQGDGSSLAPQSLPSDTAQPSSGLQNTGGTSGLQNTGGTQGTPTATGDNSGTLLVNPLKGIDSLSDLLSTLLDALVDIGTIVLILALIWVGFSFVRAQGKSADIEKAKSALLWTVIGGAILLGAKALSEVIQSTVSNL